jgi:hypothetical protein
VPTNSETALSASVCKTPELVEDASPKWSSHLQVEFFTFLVSGVTTTCPIQFCGQFRKNLAYNPIKLFHRSDLRVQRLEFPPEQNYAVPPFSLGLQTSDLKPPKASSDMTFILGKALKSPKQIKIELNRAACPGSCAVWRLCCWWFRGGCCRVSVRSWLARSARTVVGASDSVLTAVVQGTQLASLHLRHWFLFFSAAVVSVLACFFAAALFGLIQ